MTLTKKRVWIDTPRCKWLSLEDYYMPHWIMDYFEDQYCLVKNADDFNDWHKVKIPWKPNEGFVWAYQDNYDDTGEVTHFMLIED
jgi:hypothetical protein